MSKYLTKEAIEQIEDIKTEEVEVPEWGGIVRVRAMSGTERDQYDNILAAHTIGEPPNHKLDMKGIRAEVVALCLVDELGVRLFTDASEVQILSAKSGAALSRVYDVAAAISGLTREASEEMRKNSDGAQSASSGLSLLETSEVAR